MLGVRDGGGVGRQKKIGLGIGERDGANEPMHFEYGTQWNDVSIGCTSCMKLNFVEREL